MKHKLLSFLFGCSCVIASLFSVSAVFADEYRPAYLQLQEIQTNTFDVLWKVPVQANRHLILSVVIPEGTQVIVPTRSSLISTSYLERSTLVFDSGLVGAALAVDGLSRISTEVLVRIEYRNGSTETARLTPSSPSFIVQGEPSTGDIISTYLVFGVEHILEGMDHLLFVACLIFIAGTWRRILVTITGFTLAHSITLTLAALDVIRLPVPPIEAVIALSIVFLAREIAMERRDTITWKYPIAVSATFGLLHGFGFASALSELGLPQTEIPAALLAFNVGVEIGQIMFVTTVVVSVWIISKLLSRLNISSMGAGEVMPLQWLKLVEKPLAYGIGALTMVWTLQRTMSFLV